MRAKPRRHIRLWVLMSGIFTLILSLTLCATILSYRIALADRYQSRLRQQLTDGLADLEGADFSAEALSSLEEQGLRALILDAESGNPLFRSGARFPLPEAKPAQGPISSGIGPGGRNDGEMLRELVSRNLGDGDGSFFLTDSGQGYDGRRPALESKELYLCGRSGGRLFCLNLPVESTNAAVSLAIRYATLISLAAWGVSLILLYFLSRLLTRPHQSMAVAAAQIADLDFSQRCPPAVVTELDALSQSINSMADSLQENVEALRGANEQLQVELAERTRQQQLTADLIANLSHDLKTPIAIISGYAEGLREGVARTPEKQQAYYEMILRESEHMQRIVSRILALGRMESGETPVRREVFDLAALLDEVLESFQRELERLELSLECPDWPRPCPVCTDYACARQSILNYVQNAVYHINGGNRIEIRLQDRGGMIRVRVTNSSAPIPEAEAAKLWDKLYRGDPSRQRHHGEMGLGLAIVKGNLDRLGHAYGFENDPEFPGVSFWLELPRAAEPEKP